MYVIALKDNLIEGLYAVEDEFGQKILYLFSDHDDAERFVGLLEANDYPELEVIEVEDKRTLNLCEQNDYTYLIINPDDLMIPPDYHDPVQNN
jgi:hypothetical protein